MSGSTSRRRRTVALACAAALVTSIAASGTAHARTQAVLPAGSVSIAGQKYYWVKGTSVLGLFGANAAVSAVKGIARACPSVNFYGYASARGVGLVAKFPSTLWGCLPVTGGGPGGTSAGCMQAMKNPDPDPYRLSGLAFSRYFVLIAATSDLACRDLTTQVPGGIWTKVTRAYGALAVGTRTVIKCQAYSGSVLWDFVAPYSPLPASKAAAWIPNSYVYDQAARWSNVPSCY